MNMESKSGTENDPGSIIEAQDIIIVFLEQGKSETGQSVLGDRPNDEGEYARGHAESKAKRELLETFEKIFRIADEEVAAYSSLGAYLTERCRQMMQFQESEEIWRPVMDHIEREFGVMVKPATGPSTHYLGCMRGWAKEYGVDEAELRAFMPYERFEKIEKEGKGDDIVDMVCDHFGIE